MLHPPIERATPRLQTLSSVSVERRRIVDRRHGPERRSTLARRGCSAHLPAVESPGEHLRNGLQLLAQLRSARELDADHGADLNAALERFQRALRLLEHRAGSFTQP